MNKNQSGVTLLLVVFIVGMVALLAIWTSYISSFQVGSGEEVTPTTSPMFSPSSTQAPSTPTPTPLSQRVVLPVPFTAQAPFGEWSDTRQQDGCEEASVVMAMRWVKGEDIASRQEGKNAVLELSAYQEENYGEYRDTSAQDTSLRLIKGYYDYDNYEVKPVNEDRDIVYELSLGNLVLVPANGQMLGNPNFTPPGPERHMLVIKGYDPKTDIFITNDPGTRQGENYEYQADVLFGAIRDYGTGYHVPIETVEKRMIVVRK